jgi:gliding motility-associated protein GldM
MKTPAKFFVLIMALCYHVHLFAQSEKTAVVSADLMNLLYIGIDNPVSIAVPGIADSKVNVSISNGTLLRNNGKYIVKVDNTNDVVINVAAETAPGVLKSCGSYTFRVKRIPDPQACVAGHCGSKLVISKAALLNKPELSIKMDIPFELKFEIVSFTLTYQNEGNLYSETTLGSKFNQKMTDAINKMEDGRKIYFEDIKVKGPDGATRNLGSIAVKLGAGE